MLTRKNQRLISFPLVVLTNLLVTQPAFAAGPSTTAMLAAVSKIPYQSAGIPGTSSRTVTRNQAPLIHDDVWVARRQPAKNGSTAVFRI